MCNGNCRIKLALLLSGCPRRKYSRILQVHSADFTLNEQIKIFSKVHKRYPSLWSPLLRRSREAIAAEGNCPTLGSCHKWGRIEKESRLGLDLS